VNDDERERQIEWMVESGWIEKRDGYLRMSEKGERAMDWLRRGLVRVDDDWVLVDADTGEPVKL
jgi:hypothetical protein